MKIAFTICTNSFLSMARAAAASFLQHNREYDFYIGIIDKPDAQLHAWYDGYKIVNCEQLGIGHLDDMARKYNIVELSCALKAYFCNYFLTNHPNASEILYIDSDLYFYAPVKEVELLHQQYDILLTPHIIHPMQFDGKQPDEIAYLATGTYNGGFFSIKVNDNSKRFIRWWCERMKEYCYYNLESGLFVDQKWLNLVPVFFDKVFIILHPGYNISYWNLHERHITSNNGQLLVNNSFPLVFYHYSSINLKQGILFYKQQNRFSEDSLPLVKELLMHYRSVVMKEGYEQTSASKSYYAEIFRQHTAKELKKTLKGRIKLWFKNNVSEKNRNKLKSRLKGLMGS